jgi:hypothetical protein
MPDLKPDDNRRQSFRGARKREPGESRAASWINNLGIPDSAQALVRNDGGTGKESNDV